MRIKRYNPNKKGSFKITQDYIKKLVLRIRKVEYELNEIRLRLNKVEKRLKAQEETETHLG